MKKAIRELSLLFAAGLSLIPPHGVWANPSGFQLQTGVVEVPTLVGNNLIINQSSHSAIINWNSFSIGSGETTTFVQPVGGATMNRVVGLDPSIINGALNANGSIWLINPNGTLVGSSGVIQTGSFLASTLDISNGEFTNYVNGTSNSVNFSGSSSAGIQNLGQIQATSGDVMLFARHVDNAGTISAPAGDVGLAAGQEITLVKAGAERIQVKPTSAGSVGGTGVNNSGTVEAVQAELKANGGNIYSMAVNNSGSVRATGVVSRGGKLYLSAGGGKVTNSGSLVATSGDKGGDVEITGKNVKIAAGSKIDASGDAGGGTVLIGGDYQGKGSVATAQTTHVEEGASIRADARQNGNGGKVIVWADGATLYRGNISATGGAQGGNGGFAEVSGKGWLGFQGNVDLSAAQGVKGSLLLDPASITIQLASPDLNGDLTTGDDILADIAAGDFAGLNSVITSGALATLLGSAHVSLAATSLITVNSAVNWNSGFGLTLNSGGSLVINQALTNLGAGGITLTAGTSLTLAAGVSAGGAVALNFGQSGAGTFNFNTGASLSAGAIVNGGASGNIANLNISPATAFTLNMGAGANTVNLTSGNDAVTVTGANSLTFGSASLTGVGSLSGGLGTNSVNLTAGADAFTISGNRAGSGSGISFSNIDSVDGAGGSNTLSNTSGQTYLGATNTVAGVTLTNFGSVSTALLSLTAGNDSFTATGAGAGTFGGINFTSLTGVDGLGGTDSISLPAGLTTATAISANAVTALTIGFSNVESFNSTGTIGLTLTGGNDAFTVSGANAGSVLGVSYTQLATVDGAGGTDSIALPAGLTAVTATGTGALTASSIGFSNVESMSSTGTIGLTLTAGNDAFTVSGANAGSGLGVSYTQLASVNGSGGTNTLTNSSGQTFLGQTNTVAGVVVSNFGSVSTALLSLTAGNDSFTATGAGAGTFGGINFTSLTGVDGLGGTDSISLPAGLTTATATSANAVTALTIGFSNVESFNSTGTIGLTLTAGNDAFTVSGANAGSVLGVSYTQLATVDGAGGTDSIALPAGLTAVTATGTGALTASSIGFSNVESMSSTGTIGLTLTGGNDAFTVSGANAGSGLGVSYTQLATVDGSGGTDSIALPVGLNAVTATGNNALTASLIGFSNVESLSSTGTIGLTLTGGNDAFTVSGANAGSGLGVSYTQLATVDGSGGSNTLTNTSGLTYLGATNTVAGVAVSNFGSVSTAALSLTVGNDAFSATGAGAGTFGGISFSSLTSVDGLGGTDSIALPAGLTSATATGANAVTALTIGFSNVESFNSAGTIGLTLTGGNDAFTLSGANAGSVLGVSYTQLATVDGAGGTDSIALPAGLTAVTATGNNALTASSIGFSNVESMSSTGTIGLTLTAGNDAFTVSGANAGSGLGVSYTQLASVNGSGGSNTLTNGSGQAYLGATNTVAGVAISNFGSVSTAALSLTNGDDLFTATAASAGTFGGINFTNLTSVDGLLGTDSLDLPAGVTNVTANGLNSVGALSVIFTNVEGCFPTIGTISLTLTPGNDVFTVSGANAGSALGVSYSQLVTLNGGGGTDTLIGTSNADNWTISGSNSGTIRGIGFSSFSQLRTGGSVRDTFTFTTGSSDVTGFISGTDSSSSNLAAVALVNNAVATNLSGAVVANGLRITTTGGGSFTATNSSNDVASFSANVDGALNFSNSLSYTVGTVDGVTGVTSTGDNITLGAAAGRTITFGADVTTGSLLNGAVAIQRAAVLSANLTVTGGSVAFGETINADLAANNRTLQVNSSGATVFSGQIGNSQALLTLTTDAIGTTAINGGEVNTKGDQTYNDTVSTSGTTTLNARANSGNGNITATQRGNDFLGTLNLDANTVSIDDVNSLTLGTVTTAGNAQFDTAGQIDFSGVTTIGGNLLADSIANTAANGGPGAAILGANIIDTGAGRLLITGSTGLTAGTGDITLDNVTNDFDVGNSGDAVTVTSSGNLSLDDANQLKLSTVNAGGNVSFDAAGQIEFSGVATIGGNLLASSIANGGAGANIIDTGAGRLLITGSTGLTAGTGDITLDNVTNDFDVGNSGDAVTVTSSGNLSLDDANQLKLSTVNAGGNANFDAAGQIEFSGVATIGGNLLASSIANGGAGANIIDTGAGRLLITGSTGLTAGTGDITLDNVTNDFDVGNSGDAVTVTSSGNLSLDDANQLKLSTVNAGGNANFDAAGQIEFSGVATIGGNLLASSIANGGAGANIIDTGAGRLLITGSTGLTAGTGDITLDNVTNDFDVGNSGDAVTVTSSGNLSLDDANQLKLSTVNAGGNANFDAAGQIEFSGVATIGGNLLASSIANGGAGANIIDTGAGRLLITGSTGLTAGTGDITLDNVTNDFDVGNSGDAVTVTSSGNLSLDDANQLKLSTVNAGGNANFDAAGQIEFSGVATIGGNLLASSIANGGAGANIIDTGAGRLLITGSTGLTAGTGDITLDNALNDFQNTLTLSGGATTIVDANNLAAALSTGGTSLSAGGSLGVSGTSGDLTTGAGATTFGATTVNGDLSTTASGAVTQTGVLEVTGTSSVNAGGNAITLINPLNDFTGAVSLTNTGLNNISIVDKNALILGNISMSQALGGALSMTAGGHITQFAGATITTGTGAVSFTGANGTDVIVGNAGNAFNGSVTFSPSVGAGNRLRDITILDTTALQLQAGLNVGRNLVVTALGITQAAGGIIVAGNATFNGGAGVVTLADAANDFIGSVGITNSGANNVSIRDVNLLDFATTSVGTGTLTINATGISQSGAITQAATAGLVTITGNGGAITLNNAGNNFVGDVTATSTAGINLRDSNSLQVAAAGIIAGTTLTLQTGTGITQVGKVSATTLNVTAGGDVLLSGLAGNTGINQITNLGTVAVTGAGNDFVLIDQGGGLNLTGNVSAAGGVKIVTQGGMAVTGNVTVSGAAPLSALVVPGVHNNTPGGNSVVLVANHNSTTGLLNGPDNFIVGTGFTFNVVGPKAVIYVDDQSSSRLGNFVPTNFSPTTVFTGDFNNNLNLVNPGNDTRVLATAGKLEANDQAGQLNIDDLFKKLQEMADPARGAQVLTVDKTRRRQLNAQLAAFKQSRSKGVVDPFSFGPLQFLGYDFQDLMEAGYGTQDYDPSKLSPETPKSILDGVPLVNP